MTDNWDTDSMNRSIHARSRQLEHRNDEILKYKIKTSHLYKREYDENLGALQVNIHFENSICLKSKETYIAKLKELKNEKPIKETSMFDYENVSRGWAQEINMKLGSYSE